MTAEFAGATTAWLAHLAWYVAAPRDGITLVAAAARRPIVARGIAVVVLGVSVACWITAHGPALGASCALGALLAAASVDSLVGPLAPRGLVRAGAITAIAVAALALEALRG